MPRLSQRQWDNIEKRLLAGESAYAIAKDYPVTQQAISKRFCCSLNRIKDVANQIFETETNFQKLCKSEQISCANFAEELLAISGNLATGARFSAMTFSRLSKLAHAMTETVDDQEINPDVINEIARLQRTANEAAKTPMDLIKANQSKVQKDEHDDLASMTEEEIRAELARLEGVC